MRLGPLLRRALEVNKFTTRTHTCGELRNLNEGERVRLKGWVSFKRLNRFVVLRDCYGSVQAVVPDGWEQRVKGLTAESVVEIVGVVRSRGKDVNPNMETGKVEVLVEDMTVLNLTSSDMPITAKNETQEKTRLSYRYLDLRSQTLQTNLRLRSSLMHNFRKQLVENLGFVDVETPTLSQWTPGGAHEFIVPCGKKMPGHFYSLPQSPQIFKQLLMIGGIDRYFQLARCYRDEGSKLDRQPEFTQLDLEMSFCDQKDVMSLVEHLLLSSWPDQLSQFKPTVPFKRLTFESVMRDYGSDKPDLRIPWKLQDCTSFLAGTPLQSTNEEWYSFMFVAKNAAKSEASFKKNEWKRLVQLKHPNAKVEVVNLQKKNPFKGFDTQKFSDCFDLSADDVVVFSWGTNRDVCRSALGDLRNFVGDAVGLRREPRFEWLWVVDFPLFTVEDGQLCSTHHPFTAPQPDSEQQLWRGEELTDIKAQHYDLVLNGAELGGGSIRIHDCRLQNHVIDLLKLPKEPLEGFVNALSMGAPPHGGFALGLDRYVALLAAHGNSTASIRDVIAFPKTKEGRCLTTGAPGVPPPYVLDRYSIQVKQ